MTHPRMQARVGGHRLLGVFLMLVAFAGGCGVERPRAGDAGEFGARSASSDVRDSVHGDTDVVVDGREVLLVSGGDRRRVATLTERDGEVVHASVRPGDHAQTTVLLLTRVTGPDGPDHELRYLVVGDDAGDVTDVYWFPWRLGIADDVVGIGDTPPTPVWAPDGSALAWIESTHTGTRLRTVGWFDDGHSVNPSDDAVAYRLHDVEPGTQLESWERTGDEPAFLARHPEQGHYRLEVTARDIAAG